MREEDTIDSDNYIAIGDHVIAVTMSAKGSTIQGRVIEVEGKEFGRRAYVVEAVEESTSVATQLLLREDEFIFEVERGDSWVLVPSYLLPERAEQKAKRAVRNAERRLRAKVPLFADQFKLPEPASQAMISSVARRRTEILLREHLAAIRSTSLRSKVQSVVSADQYASLVQKRSKYPRSAVYGIEFWQEQLEHVQNTGQPRICGEELPTIQADSHPEWLRPDAEILWTPPRGSRTVRVLFVGSRSVLVKILGRPPIDYDPKEFPNGNLWTSVRELAPSLAPRQ
jgi:hypothetical protein